MRRSIGTAATLVALVLAGCGGNDNNSSSKTTSESAQPAGPVAQSVAVSETEFKLNPANPKITKAGVVEFDVKNAGQTGHSLEVEGPKGEAKLASTLQPGQSAKLKVDLSKPGRYEWYCPVGNHRDLGMKGEIVVAGSGGASTTTGSSQSGQSGGGSGGSNSGSSNGGSGRSY